MTIVKRGSKFRVVSGEGKNLGEAGSKEGAVKRLRQVEWFKHHKKCIVDPSLVKALGSEVGDSDGNIAIYKPVIFNVAKPQDKEAQKLDFPSTTKQLELKDVKQPQFPSTPFTGEAYSESFHNPRPSNSVKDGTHVIVQGDNPHPQQAGPFRGEHGPDIQFKGSDYVPKTTRKSIMIAGKRVVIRKGSEGSDNENLRNYPIDKDKGEPLDPRNESQKRKDWIRNEKVKEDVRAYDEAKRNYAPGNGPMGLAMDTKTSYLGRSMGKFFDDKTSMKVLSDKEIKAKQKADKEIEAPKKVTRELRIIKKAKGIMRLILQYTQNQPLAAGFKPLLAHLVQDEEDPNMDERTKKKKAMSTEDIAEKVSKFPSKGPSSKSRIRLMERASQQKTDNTSDEAGPHPDFGPSGGYKGDTSKLGKGAFKDKWIKQQEAAGKDPSEVPKKKEKPNYKDPTTRMLMTDDLFKPATKKSSRANPIKGGIGDKLEYKDVDEKELEEGVKVEQEHVKNSDDDEDKKKVKAADIAMDHLEEDDKYYTHLNEMEREAKEEDKADTKKKKLLKIVDKSFVFKRAK